MLGPFQRQYQSVILFFLDAFGWHLFNEHRERHPFLQRLTQAGHTSCLTAQFPSTTTAHVTCIHTGLPVGQHGLYEWNYYEPKLDAVISPLLYSYAGDGIRDTLKNREIAPEELFPTKTLYQTLARQGVSSYVLQYHEYTPSTYSNVVFEGAQTIPYHTLSEALVHLRFLLSRQQQPTYYFLYFAQIDALAHTYGPESVQVAAEIDTTLMALERLLAQNLAGQMSDTLFILTADHGQIRIDPNTTVYLNLDTRFTGIERFLKTDRNGNPIIGVGSSRDPFLHIRGGMVDEAREWLANRLVGQADVVVVKDLIEEGYFGPQPLSTTLLSRIGDLVILPYLHETIWWYVEGRFEQHLYGQHSGLTRAEMEIPFCLYDFG